MPDFQAVGAPGAGSYGSGLVDFSALSGGKPQQQQQQPQQQQNPGYSLGDQIGKWLQAYRQQMQQNGMPTSLQSPNPGPAGVSWTPGGPGGSVGPNSGSAVY
jgi:hypothetical protein